MFSSKQIILFLGLLSTTGQSALGMDKTHLERMPIHCAIHSNTSENNNTETDHPHPLLEITSKPVVAEMREANTFSEPYTFQQTHELAQPPVDECQSSRKRPRTGGFLETLSISNPSSTRHRYNPTDNVLRQSQTCAQLLEQLQGQVSQCTSTSIQTYTQPSIIADIDEYNNITIKKDGVAIAQCITQRHYNDCEIKSFISGNRYCVCLYFQKSVSEYNSALNLRAVYVCDTTDPLNKSRLTPSHDIVVKNTDITDKLGNNIKSTLLISLKNSFTLVVSLRRLDNSFIVTKSGSPYILDGTINTLY